MIELCIRKNGIQMHGHAGYIGPDGIDRVCSAVSALTCAMINALTDLCGEQIRTDTGSGMTVVEWENLSDGGKLLVDAWFLSLVDIDREYNCIEFQ